MNTLNSYGYNDGDNSLLSLKMKQQAIDNAQDKKINNLSKQSGGEALKVCVNLNNSGAHNNLTKQEAFSLLNISESDFDRLMNGEIDKVLLAFFVGAVSNGAEIKVIVNVFYERASYDNHVIRLAQAITNMYTLPSITAQPIGFNCVCQDDNYGVIIPLPSF